MAARTHSGRARLGLVVVALAMLGKAALAQDAPAPLAELALSHANALRLSPDQARQLSLVRVDAEIAAGPAADELRLLNLKLRRGRTADPAHFKPDAATLARIDALELQLSKTRRAADRQTEAVLSPEQEGQLEQAMPRDAPSGAATGPAPPDAKLFEFETSEAITDRLFKWAQLFALAVGVPLAILAAVLGVLGVRSFRDLRAGLVKSRQAFDEQFAEAKQSLEHRLSAAKEAADRMDKQVADYAATFAALDARIAKLPALEQNVTALADKVDRIERAVSFEKSKALTPQLAATLEQTLNQYRDWLESAGCPTGAPINVFVDPKAKALAYYTRGRMVIGAAQAGSPDVVLRFYTHHALGSARSRRNNFRLHAVQYGLVDYLPCSFRGSPLRPLGKQGAQGGEDVDQSRSIEGDAQIDPSVEDIEGMRSAGFGWSGAFWEIRGRLPPGATDRILIEAWKTVRMAPTVGGTTLAFARSVANLAEVGHPAKAAAVRQAFERRGVSLALRPAKPRTKALAAARARRQ